MTKKMLIIVLGLVGFVSLFGCSSQGAFEYRDQTEIADGPGLFSGTDGALVSVGKANDEDNGSGPSDFIEWKKEFDRSGEAKQYEMWLDLKKR